MPDYFPIFNSTGRRVFNSSGQPVFGRIRNGSVSFTLGTRVVFSGSTNYSIPGGTVSISHSYTLTRSNYATFSSDATEYYSDLFLGTDAFSRTWTIRAKLKSVTFGYLSGSGFRISANHTGVVLLSGVESTLAASITPGYTKASSLYIPEGTYTPSPSSGTNGTPYNGQTDVYADPNSVSVTFTEA